MIVQWMKAISFKTCLLYKKEGGYEMKNVSIKVKKVKKSTVNGLVHRC